VAASAALALSTASCTIIVENNLTPQCSKHSDCKGLSTAQAPVICNEKKHVCAPLFTDECGKPGSKYSGAFFNKEASVIGDDTIILGAILTLSGPTDADYSSGGKPPRDAMKFALDQINTQGIPSPALKRTRPLAILACDDFSQDDGEPIRAAKHLAGDIGVPVIIGGTGTTVTLNIAKEVSLNEEVLLISPSATGTALSSLTTQDSRHLVWRTAPPDTYQSKAMAAYIEKHLRTKMPPIDPRTAKIYIFNQDSDYGRNFGSLVNKDLATLTGNISNIHQLNFGAEKQEQATVNTDLQGAVPDVVILIGYDDTVPYMQAVENSVMTQVDAKKPFYMFSDGGQSDALWKVAAQNAMLRNRIFGTAPGQLRTNATYGTFYNDLKAANKNASPEIFGSAGAYDIVYLLSFAMARLLNTPAPNVTEPITGLALGAGLTHVSKGPVVTVGGPMLAESLHTAQTSSEFDFEGASGHLQFGNQGEAPSDIQVWCIPSSPDSKNPAGAQNSKIYYDPVTNVLQGTAPAKCD
jgi:ABC-type branched-subunit amino acid transport system substrate-binding protein